MTPANFATAALLSALMACDNAGPADPDANPCPPGLDEFEIVSHEVRGQFARLDIQYSGGCAEHDFTVWWTGLGAPSCPASAAIELQHYANGDSCDTLVTESIWVDLTPTLEQIGFCNGALKITILVGTGTVVYGFRLEESDFTIEEPPEEDVQSINLDCGVVTS